MLNKALMVTFVTLTLTACGASLAVPDEEKSTAKTENMSEYEKQLSLTKQANKVKCQDARMDMVDAEAEGDVNMIRLVKARLQKYCEPDE